ncbi:DUF6588 family protein [Psychroserpens luteus]|uniref:DUF6588 family protein n=1 Tax=Psychroserpens luteus TaxID=1434066 RepID=A0ABW5ZTS6_9FLAO|nr:DUF6588 family protein [Psychroserpens luteus]
MKKIVLISIAFLAMTSVKAQENVNDLLAAGISDAERFTKDYIAPASEGLGYGINNGWFNNAKSPRRFSFQLSVIGNIGFIKDDKKSFQMNVADYENIRFEDGSSSKMVATALGHNDPEIRVIITYDDPLFGNQETTLVLPTGIGAEGVDLIPTGFLQAGFSPFKGTQIKGRFIPKIETEDAKIGLYGIGLQQEFTSWLPADKILPIAVSGLVAYTHLDGSYDFTDAEFVEGENQRVETDVNTVLFELIVGTNLKIINVYGAVGYITGTATTDLLGTYRVTDGFLFSEEINNPFSIENDISGVRGTVGANLKLGFFSLNADYNIAEFDSATLGINFSF